jgi:hypothetical protein
VPVRAERTGVRGDERLFKVVIDNDEKNHEVKTTYAWGSKTAKKVSADYARCFGPSHLEKVTRDPGAAKCDFYLDLGGMVIADEPSTTIEVDGFRLRFMDSQVTGVLSRLVQAPTKYSVAKLHGYWTCCAVPIALLKKLIAQVLKVEDACDERATKHLDAWAANHKKHDALSKSPFADVDEIATNFAAKIPLTPPRRIVPTEDLKVGWVENAFSSFNDALPPKPPPSVMPPIDPLAFVPKDWSPSVGEFVTWPRNGRDGPRVVGVVMSAQSKSGVFGDLWGQVAELTGSDVIATMSLYKSVPLAPLPKEAALEMYRSLGALEGDFTTAAKTRDEWMKRAVEAERAGTNRDGDASHHKENTDSADSAEEVVKVWCAHSKDALGHEMWCALASQPKTRVPRERNSVRTLCRHVIILPGGTEKRTPTCLDCRDRLKKARKS